MHMLTQNKPLRIIVVMLASAMVFSACGDDEPGPNITPQTTTDPNNMTTGSNQGTNTDPNNQTSNNQTTNNATSNMSSNNMSSNNMSSNNMSSPNNTSTCEGADCEEFSVFGECDFVNDQGTVSLANGATNLTLSGSTVGLESDIASSCAADAMTAPEYIWSFVPSEASFVTISIMDDGGLDWVVSTRSGECEPTNERVCRDSGLIDYLAGAEERQFIVAEPVAGVQTGSIDINVQIEPAVCSDLGARTCDADGVKVCEGGTMETTYRCGTGCDMGVCEGDVCDNAFALQGGASYEFEGNMRAYTNNFNAADFASCSLGGVLTTPGAEQILSVPGVTAGQTITVKANDPSDQNDNAIFILRGCGAGAECVAVDELADELSWSADADGDYTIIIDSISNANKEFKHSITVE